MKTPYWILLVATAFLSGRLGTNNITSAMPAPVAVAGVHSPMTNTRLSDLAPFPQHQVLLEQYRAIARRQEQQTNDLQSTVSEMETAFDVFATEFESLKPRKSWHRARLDANSKHYAAVCEFLKQIDEAHFPTVKTWYADQWVQLTAAYDQHHFPTASQRDALVKLIVTLQTDEERRVAELSNRNVRDLTVGYCLTAIWSETLEHLRAFDY